MDWGAILGGGASGAGAGLALGGPVGAGVGAGIGAISSLFGNPSTSGGSNGGLLDAFSAGLKSIGIPIGGSSSTPQTIVQEQNVSQGTSVNVSNVLGGQPFGSVDAEGNFDIFQAIADVYKIKDAQNTLTDQPVVTGGGALDLMQPATKNYLPLVLGIAALAAVFLLTKKGK